MVSITWELTNMPQLEYIEAIEKRLWTAAYTLRANSSYAPMTVFRNRFVQCGD